MIDQMLGVLESYQISWVFSELAAFCLPQVLEPCCLMCGLCKVMDSWKMKTCSLENLGLELEERNNKRRKRMNVMARWS